VADDHEQGHIFSCPIKGGVSRVDQKELENGNEPLLDPATWNVLRVCAKTVESGIKVILNMGAGKLSR
jgi:hypothetical protein